MLWFSTFGSSGIALYNRLALPCPAIANIFVGHGMLMKIGDLGMSRHVYPPPPEAASTGPSLNSSLNGSLQLGFSIRHTSHSSSNPSTPHAGRRGSLGPGMQRTLTPGIVGTMAYAAPELVDEQLQIPRAPVERLLKVGGMGIGRSALVLSSRCIVQGDCVVKT